MIILPTIRLAAGAEAAPIARMSREYIEYGLGWSWTPQRVMRAIDDRATNVVVSHDGEAILGFGIMSYGETKAHLVLLGVEPARRQRGLGAALLAWLEKCALTAGLQRVQLEARADNPGAITFYEEQGYRAIGSVAGYYRGAVDAVRMEKRLGIQTAI
jgi:[ribosomal protein S18]-alanine N-acetyltransferase